MKTNILNINSLPFLKVALRTDQSFYDVTICSSFTLIDKKGTVIHREEKKKSTWRFKLLDKPKKLNLSYNYIIKEFYQKKDAEILQKELGSIETEIHEVGGDVYFNNQLLNNNRKFLLVTKQKYSHSGLIELTAYLSNQFNLKKFSGLNERIDANIEIFDSNLNKNFLVNETIRIEMDDPESEVIINNIEEFDNDYERFFHKNYYLNGNFIISVNREFSLDFINVISSEKFIHRAIFSELGNNMPLEFYKSMAVVCRCYILNRIGQVHVNQNYDFHARNDHLFFNPVRYKNKLIDKAIQETKFEALYYGDDVCQAFYSIVCGGVCENGNDVLSLHKKLNYLSRMDSLDSKENLSLINELHFKKWVNSSPDVLCNLHSLEDLPPQLKLGKKYFRWEEFVSASFLEKRIKEITNIDFGFLVDLIPKKRGKSGRIIELEILGSHKNILLSDESLIRKVFSKTKLPSSAFYIEREYDEHGFINELILKGAGFGHGVGLCKTGATIMAENGKSYKDILNHYFESSEIKRIF